MTHMVPVDDRGQGAVSGRGGQKLGRGLNLLAMTARRWYDRRLREPVGVTTLAASAASATKSAMCPQWFLSETVLKRLSQDLEDMARALGQLIQE